MNEYEILHVHRKKIMSNGDDKIKCQIIAKCIYNRVGKSEHSSFEKHV